MKVFSEPGSPYFYYDFRARGRRHRGSTGETNQERAFKIATFKYAKALEGKKPKVKKAPTLRAAGKRFESWVATARIAPDSRRYYLNGWRVLQAQKVILDIRMDEITADDIDALEFPGSGSNANNALRTLRRIFNKAKKDWNEIDKIPTINLVAEHERTARLDKAAEEQLLEVAEQPLADIVVLMRDLGVRNARELYPMRIENIQWHKQLVSIPDSKTRAGERLVPLSHRAEEILRARCGDRREGWVFPSRQKGKHITGGLVNKQWVRARKKAGLPRDLVLYCARHDYGTDMTERTGNLKAVMEIMGHVDVKTALKYQHPGLHVVGEAIRARS